MPKGELRSEKLRKQQFKETVEAGIKSTEGLKGKRFGRAQEEDYRDLQIVMERGQKRKKMLDAVERGAAKAKYKMPQQSREGFNFLKKP